MGLFKTIDTAASKDQYQTPAEEAPVIKEAPVEEVKEKKMEAENLEQFGEIAVISASTKIDGNVTTEGNLVLRGSVQGNVTAKGNLVLNGTAQGEIRCDSLIAETFEINSDITADNNIIIKDGTVIYGNINCTNITVFGSVEGNIFASGAVILKSSAVINGNIKSETIGIESGARVKGSVECRQ